MRHRVHILLMLVFIPFACFSQEGRPYFEHISIEHGLSNDQVNCILQDRKGFIWIGTDDGLNRYDGKNFTVFRYSAANSGSISGNQVTGLHEDKEGILWIATRDGGLSSYNSLNPSEKKFRQFRNNPSNPRSIPVNIINAIKADHKGKLWLATSGHAVIAFDKKNETFISLLPKGPKTINDICIDENGNLYAGRQGGGMLMVNTNNLQLSEDERYQNLYANLPHSSITAVYRDRQRNLWFGSWDKILYRQSAGKTTSYNPGGKENFVQDEIHAIAEDVSGNLWMGGIENGLQVYRPAERRFYNFRHDPSQKGSVSSNRINCIFIDARGKIWIGTDRGISISNPFKQQFQQLFLGTRDEKITVHDFFEDEDGSIIAGTSKGLYLLNNGTKVLQPVNYKGKSLEVSAFFRDEDGNLYLGTDYSFFLYNKTKNLVSLLPNTEKDEVINRIIDSRIVSIIKQEVEGKPSLIVLPYGHLLAYYILSEKKWVSRLDTTINIVQRFNIRDNLIRKMIKASNGIIYLANAKEGLGRWDVQKNKPIEYLKHAPGDISSVSVNNVFDIIEDDSGNLWVSTYGGGIHYFRQSTKKFEHIAQSPNLTEGIQLDGEGNPWMIFNGNIGKFDPVQKKFTRFSLPDRDQTGGVKGKIFRDRKGYFYVSGQNYIIRFHPDSVAYMLPEPTVHLSDFSIFNKSFSHLLAGKKIRLNYRDNYFSIGFSAPYYEEGNDIEYAYMLEGFDDDWVSVGSRNLANFSNLDYGTYTFKVRTSHSPGTWNSNIASISIEIVPPFWKTNWFAAVIVFLIALVLYVIYRYRLNEVLMRQEIRNRIARDLHDNVGSTLSSISVYSQVARIYQAQEKDEELRNTIEKISSASVEMISELNDTVWAINPRNDQVKDIIARMESFTRPLLASQGIGFHFDHDRKLDQLVMDMDKRKNFYLVYKEAVNNAIKYAHCSVVKVSIKLMNQRIVLEINDDGTGFDPSATSEGYKSSDVFGNGNGLKNMQMRASQLKGSLKINSATGKGTTIILSFPIT